MRRPVLGDQWPLTLVEGTLGCIDDAVVFRARDKTYAVNAVARSRGFSPIEPILLFEGSGPPSNPLGRIKQDVRTQIFAEASACERRADAEVCKAEVRTKHRLSDADLKQVEAEGHERRWPPLPREKMRLQPLVDRGLKLCRPQ